MYLVVPNGGYNADSLPVRVDLYHESAYLCLGTNKMKPQLQSNCFLLFQVHKRLDLRTQQERFFRF